MKNSEHTKYCYLKSNYNIECEPFTNIETNISIKIFNGEIYTSIAKLYNSIKHLEDIKEKIFNSKETLQNVFIQNNSIHINIETKEGQTYSTTIGGYKRLYKHRVVFQNIVKNNEDILLSTYIGAQTKVLIDFKCGHEPNFVTPNSYLSGSRCPICANRITLPYINDCYTTAPELLQYFVDEKDAIGMSANDINKRLYKCPKCNCVKEDTLHNIKSFGFSCPVCSDGISYPEKLMYSILTQLKIDFEIHKTFKWCKFKIHEKEHFGIYDFVINNLKLIIEMDGRFHYSDNNRSGNSLRDSKELDFEKDKLAIENGYKIIRIDCNYKSISNRFDHIKNSIVNSLNDFLNLKKIDWETAQQYALNSNLIIACQLWEEGFNSAEIAQKLQLNISTIINYLKIGKENNICGYTRTQAYKRRDIKSQLKLNKYVKVLDSNNKLIGIFFNLDSFIQNYFELTGIKISKRNIREVLNGTHKSTHKLYFVEISQKEYRELSKLSEIIKDN
jgi:very-short-patch-repair endonuclease